MPNKDGTGPQGRGPKTGRQEGDCEGAKPIGRGFGFGRGFGRRCFGQGFGFGRGLGFRQSYVEPTKQEEKAYLEAELKAAEEDLKEIKKRLQEIK